MGDSNRKLCPTSQLNTVIEWLGARWMQVTFGEIFFPLKVPEFLHVLFNLVEKHSPVSFLAEMLLPCFVAFIVHAFVRNTKKIKG